MIRLTTSTLVKLRDRLREAGARNSLPLGANVASPDDTLAKTLAATFGPLCEAMYIMMAADGTIAGAERDVIRGALRELDPRIRSVHVEAMLVQAARAVISKGRAARIADLGATLAYDPPRAEAAFQLAAAVAAADDVLAQEEKDVLRDLGAALGIPQDRARELFAALEQVDAVVGRGAGLDPTSILLHAAMRVASPEDFERLAATSTRREVTFVLRLYAAFMRSGEELREKGDAAADPALVSAARVAALEELVRGMKDEASKEGQALRVSLARLAVALAEADRATALRPLEGGGAVAMLEESIVGVAEMTTEARRRCGEPLDGGVGIERTLSAAVARTALVDGPATRAELERAVHAWCSRVERAVPPEIASAVVAVVRRLGTLPAEVPRDTPPPKADATPALPPWLPQKRVLGGFYVLAPLGGGGAGSVFVVVRSDERDEPGAERFALKVPHYEAAAAHAISEAEFLKLFREEAGALLSLPEQDNLARFITFDARARPKPLLVMELVEGTPCDVLVDEQRLDTTRALSILDGVLAGLSAMHGAGIGHLDVKPPNVIVRGDGKPVLVDFGLSGKHLRPGCATVPYGAPEIWGVVPDGAVPSPLEADVYAFGCLAFEVVTGKILFDAPDDMKCVARHVTNDGLPEPVQRLTADPRYAAFGAVLYHCLRRDGRLRPTIQAVHAEMRRIEASLARLAWPIGKDVLG